MQRQQTMDPYFWQRIKQNPTASASVWVPELDGWIARLLDGIGKPNKLRGSADNKLKTAKGERTRSWIDFDKNKLMMCIPATCVFFSLSYFIYLYFYFYMLFFFGLAKRFALSWGLADWELSYFRLSLLLPGQFLKIQFSLTSKRLDSVFMCVHREKIYSRMESWFGNYFCLMYAF